METAVEPMKRYLLLFIFTSQSVCFSSSLILDQSFEWESPAHYGGFGSASMGKRQAQTFTVGVTGSLRRIEIAVRPEGEREEMNTDQIEIFLVQTVSGLPNLNPASMLASSSETIPTPGSVLVQGGENNRFQDFHWAQFDLPPTSVVSGELLAIVLSTEINHGYHWAASFPGSYLYGRGLRGSSEGIYAEPPINFQHRDWLFRTYVVPIPEPSGALLLALGTITLCAIRKRRS